MQLKIKKWLVVVLLILIMAVGCYVLWEPLMAFASHPERVREMGPVGVMALIGAVFIQIVLAFLPGEMLEITAGLIYGPWWGLLICMAGAFLGSSCVFLMVQKLGIPLVEKFFPKQKIEDLRFLKNEKKLFSLLFIIFFIPGTPKDLLTYVMPLTKLTFQQFIVITTLARIPSILTSTLGGDLVASQNYFLAAITFIVTGIIALIGMHYYQKKTTGA